MSPNALIHVDQTSVPGVAVAVNKYFALETHLPPPPAAEMLGPVTRRDNLLYHEANVTDYRDLGLSLEGSECALLSPDTLFVVLRSGECVLVELVGHDDAGVGWRRRKSGVKRFLVVRLGFRCVMPFALTRVGGVGCAAWERAAKSLGLGGVAGSKWTTGLARCLGGLGGVGGGEVVGGGVNWCYVFIGSRTADGVLIRISELDGGVFTVTAQKAEDVLDDHLVGNTGIVKTGDAANEDDASSSSKILGGGINGANDDDDDDDDDLYGDSNADKDKRKMVDDMLDDSKAGPRFQFRVCDRLPCAGPIRDMVVGEPAKYFDDEYTPDNVRKDLEVVSCLGEGVSGALGIFQRNVRPRINTTVEFPGVEELWSIRCSDGSATVGRGYHKFLVLSKKTTTTVNCTMSFFLKDFFLIIPFYRFFILAKSYSKQMILASIQRELPFLLELCFPRLVLCRFSQTLCFY
jgi:hypothetical protein